MVICMETVSSTREHLTRGTRQPAHGEEQQALQSKCKCCRDRWSTWPERTDGSDGRNSWDHLFVLYSSGLLMLLLLLLGKNSREKYVNPILMVTVESANWKLKYAGGLAHSGHGIAHQSIHPSPFERGVMDKDRRRTIIYKLLS